MSKRMKIIISVVMAVLLLTVGTTATVMAEEDTPPAPEVSINGLLARVADILGIPEEQLADAFEQARQEMKSEAFTSFLDKALESGRITQEEYNAILEWREARPEAMDSLCPRALGTRGLLGRHMWGGHRFGFGARMGWAR